MSNSAIANINHSTWLLNATTTAQITVMGFQPEKVILYNKGTVPIYVRAVAGTTPSLVLPTNSTSASYGLTEIPPGIPYTLNWSTTQTTQNLEYIASASADFSIKLSNGK